MPSANYYMPYSVEITRGLIRFHVGCNTFLFISCLTDRDGYLDNEATPRSSAKKVLPVPSMAGCFFPGSCLSWICIQHWWINPEELLFFPLFEKSPFFWCDFFPLFFDLFVTPGGGEDDFVFSDPVMGSTGEIPVSDGGMQSHNFAVKCHTPIGRA